MKKALIKLFVAAFLAVIFLTPSLGAAQEKIETPKETKKTDAVKKTVKKAKKKAVKKAAAEQELSAKTVAEEKNPIAIDELKLDVKKENMAPKASVEETPLPVQPGVSEAKKTKAKSSENYANENLKGLESNIPTSSNIEGLLTSSNDMSILLPKETGGRWGLVLNYNYYKFIDEDKSNAMVDSPTGADAPDLRFYVGKKFENNDSYYMRLRYGRLNLKGDNSLAVPNSRNIGLKFDMLYYTFQRRPNVSLKLGRQFLSVGRGMTYAGVHDGISYNKALPKWYLKAFAARTQPRETNADQSNNGYLNRSYRDFYAVQADYLALKNKKLYGYLLFEKDGNVKIPANVKDFTYDANYFGLGLEGSFKPNWPYYMEAVMQGGKTSASNTNTTTDSVKANAYYLGTEYYMQNDPKKTFYTLEYAHASGDPDRTSVTNVIGGNVAGTTDKNFMTYGIYDLGLALHPRYSNINVIKFGGFFKPFYKNELTRELQLGAKYFIYTKDSDTGLMSDSVATMANKNLGNAYDLYLTWRILSDTLVYFNYGVFTPGDAYPTNRRDKTKLINFGTTLFF
ncbi:MAG TPA: alginate export family protein [Candidatus Wallbacteria bacterium]|nr:alginate export family protein [Candidatus Wallbacteria bacterium]